MPRWSDVMHLHNYKAFVDKELKRPGVYEIGFYRPGWFYPKYIGKAENQLVDRIKTYGDHLGNRSHNATIRSLSPATFYQLHFRVMRLDTEGAAAVREALMLIRHRYGTGSPYVWNGKYELAPLRDAGYTITDVRERV